MTDNKDTLNNDNDDDSPVAIRRNITGVPSKYSSDMCEKIIKEASQGGHIPAMMLAIGVGSKSTWYDWIDTYPEFKAAVEFAKIVSQDFYERVGLQGALGKIPYFNANTYATIMYNKFKDDYVRQATSTNHTEITVNQLSLSNEERQEKIAQKIEKLRNLGYDLLPQGNVIAQEQDDMAQETIITINDDEGLE